MAGPWIESEVMIMFDHEHMDDAQYQHLKNAEESLKKAGIEFKTKAGGHGDRYWFFNNTLRGPVTVYHERFPEGGDEIAVENPD